MKLSKQREEADFEKAKELSKELDLYWITLVQKEHVLKDDWGPILIKIEEFINLRPASLNNVLCYLFIFPMSVRVSTILLKYLQNFSQEQKSQMILNFLILFNLQYGSIFLGGRSGSLQQNVSTSGLADFFKFPLFKPKNTLVFLLFVIKLNQFNITRKEKRDLISLVDSLHSYRSCY